MYYSIFEGLPHEDKVETAVRYYKFLLPKVQAIEGFRGDNFYASPHVANKSVNVGEWDDSDSVRRWRNENNHLNSQSKASHGVYDSYRLRLGPAISEGSNDESAHLRHFMTLLYQDKVDGTPSDDVTSLLDGQDASSLKDSMIDSVVYEGQRTLWITGWRSQEAAMKFQKALSGVLPGNIVRLRIERDYTKTDRKDAPHQVAGTKL